ncbi:TIGR02147 family protein [Pseudobacteriovorax antillogorgiicola]|uniref:TIGR02147 family protein n=1 Tax=Pseudobacteriovorax antillogorgiicola TaxID=1513793 RepID=A0A1Y6BYP3_9BACT|nr:TIGR02147 family protein [Pseudobacteriovorax antillogorgiicola]TCS52963.1 uncharacterized protein (TIGR02147 family) [Pseudobacteriovorax antillogorgiicola]SMF27494.1 TIGR02147 family protein [Pseudobacteriovorax antillogorgiicola]
MTQKIVNGAPKEAVAALKPASILRQASCSGQAIKGLYLYKKTQSDKFSIGYISKATGASKGYISDVMSGRRFLNPRYWDAFSEVFGLDISCRTVLHLLISFDVESDEAERKKLCKELQAARKTIDTAHMKMPSRAKGVFFAFEVFCAFGLFGGRPSRSDLRSYFGSARSIELDYALQLLKEMGVIVMEGGVYHITETTITFGSSEDGVSYYDFIKDSLTKAMKAADRWAKEGQDSIFESTLISVRKADYLKLLPKIQSDLHRLQADLETSEADELIRFNIQIYPNN